jgi:serine/threonine protein kinase
VADAFEEFGPYAVYERLGQGGMATVHRAEKRGVGFRRPIALKRLLPHVAADPALVKLFVDEARLASHLRHTNVAQTYELGKVGDTFFIAMEYASGPTLAQIIRQSHNAAGDIPLTIIVNILQQVCEALDYAHNLCDETGQSLRIIHRDVSPANIIVTSTGIVKLIDFGIAKATISSVKTQTGFIKGKFGYIAPEYITGQLDARADLFAVGVVAHELMSGRRLFEGRDDFETLQNIRDMDLLPPSHWNPHVTPDLDDIVMTALQRDPAHRWQSAGAMQIALANIARAFGLVVGSQQLAEWVDWAFSQLPPDSGPVAAGSADHSDERPRPGSSLSIEVRRASASALEVTPPETPVPARSSRRSRPPSDFDETQPLERIELSRRDIEILTPSPVLESPPVVLPTPPRSSRVHDVPAPPPRVAEASGSPPPVPLVRSIDDLPVLPDIASSRELDVLPRLRRPSTRHEVAVPPAVSEFPGSPTEVAPPALARPAGTSRPTKATQKTRPQPRPAAPIAAPRARRSLVWLILLMIALGSGAMAAAYYLPDL